jgi:uncharacterized protein (UPF0332 family)
MKAEDLMAKARQAAVSARVLLDTGDADGACNRAYYAMFDAARAALLASGAPVEPEIARTHSGLISAFSLHLEALAKLCLRAKSTAFEGKKSWVRAAIAGKM